MRHALKRTALAVTLCGTAWLGAIAGAQAQAQSTACRSLIGFNSQLAIPLDPPSGGWAAVDANGDSFLGKKEVADCAVKAVTGPRAKTSTVIYQAGPMAQDECSMYNGLSSLDSKLAQGKIADAYSTVGTMIGKIDGLAATGKLADPGYAAIRRALTDVQACIATQ